MNDMMLWATEYWWLSLLALLIGISTAYWIWCVDCPSNYDEPDIGDVDTKTQPPKPLEPNKPEITAARPMNFKDAPRFDTGPKVSDPAEIAAAAAVGAAGVAAAAVAKMPEPDVPPPSEPIAAPPPKPTPEKPVVAEVVKPAKPTPAPKVEAKAPPAAKAPAKAKVETPATKVVTKSATPVAKKAEPVKTAAVKPAPAKTPAKAPAKTAEKPAKTATTKVTPVKATPVKAAPPKVAAPKAAPTKPDKPAKVAVEPKVKAEPKPKAAPSKKADAPVAALGPVINEAGKPKIASAGTGAADQLELIKGVGPKLNTLLVSLGITRFAQIAAWTAADISEVDQYLGIFTGRIGRDNWVDQAGYLAKGDLAGFAKKYGEVGSEIKK